MGKTETYIPIAPTRLTLDGLIAFCQWLRLSGVHIGPNKTAQHVLRYMAWKGEMGIVTLEHGQLLANRVASKHIGTWKRGDPLARPIATRQSDVARRRRILARDGTDCCICGRELGDDMTIEHWVAQISDGTEDDANIGLAHKVCNFIVDSWSVSEKLRIRDVLAEWLERHLPRHVAFDPDILPDRKAIWAWAGLKRAWVNLTEEISNGEVQRVDVQETSDASPPGACEV